LDQATDSKDKPEPPEPTLGQERTIQSSLFDLFAVHEIGRELKAMAGWLDAHRELTGLVAQDLRRRGVKETGREGLAAESVLRCALLKQHRQLSYAELAFHLEDSASFRAFARLPLSWTPKKSVLHKTISAIQAPSWEAINRTGLSRARHDKVAAGAVIRLDSTVTAALMHEPSDSSLLWDAVRVMARLLKAAAPFAVKVAWCDHRRAAKRRAQAIQYSRGRPRRVQHYRELITITRATLTYLEETAARLGPVADLMAEFWQAECRPQTSPPRRRVGDRQPPSVPSQRRDQICGANQPTKAGVPTASDKLPSPKQSFMDGN
jgi:IS5 family transposase